MKPPALALFLACATSGAAAGSPPSGLYETLPGYAHRPLIENYYPATSRTLTEQGTTGIKLCYDIRGRSVHVEIAESSSYRRLDEAALRWARYVRIMPGTVGGAPKPGCVLVHAKFSLESAPAPPTQDDELPLPLADEPSILDSLPRQSTPFPPMLIPLEGEAG